MLLPALGKVERKFAQAEAWQRTALTALAIERFRLANGGRLPVSLSDLVPKFIKEIPTDPFDGKSLRWSPRERGYVVYSVGADRNDNQGTSAKPFETQPTEFDETFVVYR